jgi:hypothetical protein
MWLRIVLTKVVSSIFHDTTIGYLSRKSIGKADAGDEGGVISEHRGIRSLKGAGLLFKMMWQNKIYVTFAYFCRCPDTNDNGWL